MTDGDGSVLLQQQQRELESARQAPHLQVIALTAFARPEDRDKTLAAGFDLHLSKPLKPHQLLEAIARCAGPAAGT